MARPRTWLMFGGLLLTAALLDSETGRSQTASGSLEQRVARLEHQVQTLQHRVSALDAVSFKKNGRRYTLAVNGARVEIDATGGVTVHAATRLRLEAGPTVLPIGRASFDLAPGSKTEVGSSRASPPAQADDCDPPYSIDTHGIRHVRPECLK